MTTFVLTFIALVTRLLAILFFAFRSLVFFALSMNDCAQDSSSTASSSSVPLPPVLPRPVAIVSLKLPPFWPNDPAVWFAQAEAQFITPSLTSQATKYAYVVVSLQPEIVQEVRDLLLNPPPTQ